jgi:hypothetical protein
MRRRTVLVIAAALALGGCTGPSLDPVPTTATGPWVCDGVSERSAELILGGDADVEATHNTWGDREGGFSCLLEHGGILGPSLLVADIPTGLMGWGATDGDAVDVMANKDGARKITAEFPGEGYVYEGDTAGWVCDGRVVQVSVGSVDVPGRDRDADVTNLLISTLPWACGGEEAPLADTPDP